MPQVVEYYRHDFDSYPHDEHLNYCIENVICQHITLKDYTNID